MQGGGGHYDRIGAHRKNGKLGFAPSKYLVSLIFCFSKVSLLYFHNLFAVTVYYFVKLFSCNLVQPYFDSLVVFHLPGNPRYPISCSRQPWSVAIVTYSAAMVSRDNLSSAVWYPGLQIWFGLSFISRLPLPFSDGLGIRTVVLLSSSFHLRCGPTEERS